MLRLHPVENRRDLRTHLLVFLVWLAVTGIAIWLRPNEAGHGTHRQLGLPPCPSVVMFDRPCPGCGLTTSWSNTVKGQFAAAFEAHWLGPIFYGIFTLAAILCLFAYTRKLFIDTNTKPYNTAFSILLAIFMVYASVRFAMTKLDDPIAIQNWSRPFKQP